MMHAFSCVLLCCLLSLAHPQEWQGTRRSTAGQAGAEGLYSKAQAHKHCTVHRQCMFGLYFWCAGRAGQPQELKIHSKARTHTRCTLCRSCVFVVNFWCAGGAGWSGEEGQPQQEEGARWNVNFEALSRKLFWGHAAAVVKPQVWMSRSSVLGHSAAAVKRAEARTAHTYLLPSVLRLAQHLLTCCKALDSSSWGMHGT
eukprot:1161376-Pelagomonas_calceolata.AAC.5